MAITLALVIGCASMLLSLVARSRLWLHSSGALHVWYHLGLFAVLGFLAMCIAKHSSGRFALLTVCLLLGPAMELGEALRFHGYIEWNDVRSDTLGVLFGAVAGWWFTRAPEKRP